MFEPTPGTSLLPAKLANTRGNFECRWLKLTFEGIDSQPAISCDASRLVLLQSFMAASHTEELFFGWQFEDA
jgi:hypothetical protein